MSVVVGDEELRGAVPVASYDDDRTEEMTLDERWAAGTEPEPSDP